MNIYAYASRGYQGEAIKILHTSSTHSLSLFGVSATQQRQFKLKAKALFSLLGKEEPTALIQVPPIKEFADLELAVLLAMLLDRDHLLDTVCPDILIMGKVNLDGSIATMPTILDALDIATDNRCQMLIAPSTANPYTHEKLEIVQCSDLALALHQCRRFVLYHEGEPSLPIIPKHASSTPLHPFAGIIGLEKAKKALILSAAGGLNILLYGPPGGGKTLLLNTLGKL